jgi:hypothetical protein
MPRLKATSASCLAKSCMISGIAGFFASDSIFIEMATAPGAQTLQCPSPTIAASAFSAISACRAGVMLDMLPLLRTRLALG